MLLTKTLKEEQFDIISLQQYSKGYSDEGFASLEYIVREIRKLQPEAQIVMYQTWSGYNTLASKRNSTFLNTIEPSLKKWATYVPTLVDGITYDNGPMTIIPAGLAFYLADNKYDIFSVKYPEGETNTNAGAQLSDAEEFAAATGLFRDGEHVSYYGCYLADACWYEILTGKMAPVIDNNGNAVVKKPNTIDEIEHLRRLEILRDIAHEAIIDNK